MAATTAKTRQDVENQSARERLWDSLNYTYGQRGEELAQNYNQAISQSNNAMLKRGMQRSSYGAQINANLLNQKNKALAGNTSEMIAAYQDRLGQIEQQEQEQSNWERTFAENQRQFNENLGFQKSESQRQQSNWEKEFGETTKQNEWSRKYQESESARQQSNWEKEFGETQTQNAWNREFQTNQFNYQKERDVISDEQWQKTYDEQLRQFNENMAYQRERANVSDAQWQKEYDEKLREFNENFNEQKRQYEQNFSYQQGRDTVTDAQTERAYYASWVQAIAANGGDASDDMLAKAGLSRADFNAMKAAAAESGGGGGGGSYSAKQTTPSVTDKDFLNGLTNSSMLSALNNLKNNTYTPKSDQLIGQGKNDSLYSTGSAYGDKVSNDYARGQEKKNTKANDSATSSSALKKEQNSLRKNK